MNSNYVITFALLDLYSKTNTANLVKQGQKLGFIYFKDYTHLKNLNVYDVIDFYTLSKNDDCSPILIKFEDTFCSFVPRKNKQNELEVTFYNFLIQWKNDNFEIGDIGPYFDLSRYIRLFLKLLEDFKIKKLIAEIEY